MDRRRPVDRDAAPLDADETGALDLDEAPTVPAQRPSLDGLPIAGFSRRRAAWSLGAIVTLWIIWVFARQVGDASAATARADQIRSDNQSLAAQGDALTAERELIQKQAY